MLGLTERDFTAQVIELAHLCGWRVHHCRPARRADGSWATAIQGDAGFPDLLLARDGRIMFAELKGEKGQLSAAQRSWFSELGWSSAICFLWRPSDWERIVETLK